MKLSLYIFVISSLAPMFAQTNSALLQSIIEHNAVLKNVTDNKNTYKPQIIYTQINRDANNNPQFENHYYLVDSTNYFYCASLVKLPTSILALEKLNELNTKNLTLNTTMLTDKAYPCQVSAYKDTSSENGLPSISNYIKRMLLVSDNFSYNRVFEFLNPKYIQNRLANLGYKNARIVHSFDTGCKGDAKTCISAVRFVDENNKLIYKQDADYSLKTYKNPFGDIVIGKDVVNKNKLVSEKKDFTYSNFIPLANIHQMLQNLIFHNHLPNNKRYNISSTDWEFLVKLLGMYPREVGYPRYDTKTFHDSFKKYFIYGNKTKVIENDSIRVFNIIGYSYGFIVDCAYIVNYKTKTELMLSAVLYTNKRNSFGSGSYEYESTGIPFLKELSLELYKHERNRKKTILPNLKEFNFYEKQPDTAALKKIHIHGIVTKNDAPTSAEIIVRSINRVLVYFPDLVNDPKTGVFTFNLMPGEEYELEFNVANLPPQIIEVDTRKNKANDTINVFAEFVSPHFNEIIKTKQDSLFQAMVSNYNRVSTTNFIAEHGNHQLEDLKFKVQIGAYKFISNFNYSSVAGMPIIIRETFDDYITRFTMGNYNTFNEANELLIKLKETNIKDAFIFAVYKGKRLYLNELIDSQLLK